jgi:hypothetical protein
VEASMATLRPSTKPFSARTAVKRGEQSAVS